MLRDRLRSQNAPLVVHLAVLGVGLLVYAIVATREWFFYDDWYYLTQQHDLIWSPHVGHWSSIPALIFLGLQRAFGMDAYLPFAIPAILAHLGVVHVLWRIMLRSQVRPWIATAISLLLVFLGAGAEAVDWAVQIGFVGAITGMLGVILLLDTPLLRIRRGAIIAVLVLLCLASSEVSIPFILVAVAFAWIRHGFGRTMGIFVGPFICLLTWYLLSGRQDPAAGRAKGLSQLLAVPQYAISMLSDGLGRMFPLPLLGGLVFVALGVWWIFTFRTAPKTATLAYLLFLAAPVFAVLTGFSRIADGLATASSSRYVYVVVVAITPLLAVGIDRLTRRTALAPTVALILVVAAWNIGGMALALNIRIDRAASTRVELAKTAALLDAQPGCLPDANRPSPLWAPDVTVGDVRRWLAQDWYHPDPLAGSPTECISP
jgi:hypothetical protein